MFGIGKTRTEFGKWIDKHGIKQIDLERKTKLSRGVISRLCNEKDHKPSYRTITKVTKALKDFGYSKDAIEFWNI